MSVNIIAASCLDGSGIVAGLEKKDKEIEGGSKGLSLFRKSHLIQHLQSAGISVGRL